MNPDRARAIFNVGELIVAALFVVGFFMLRQKPRDRGFRETDPSQDRPSSRLNAGTRSDPLAQARLNTKEPLALPGFSAQAPAHEILGVPKDASQAEIQKAYREQMKRFHPDKLGRPGSSAWTDGQKIAEAINRARDEMLKRLKA